jgi:hypothetical protein
VFIAGLSPSYARETISPTTYASLLKEQHEEVMGTVKTRLLEQQEFLAQASDRPFLACQLDMTTVLKAAYITMTSP